MDFEKICMMFSMQEPYYGILLSAMNRIPTDKVKTIGVAQTGNVFTLFYNKDWIDQFPVDTVLELLKHETMHIAFGHFTMWDDDASVSMNEHHKRNAAEDFEINCYLNRYMIVPEAGGLFVEDFGWDRCLGTKEYYKKLDQREQEMAQKQKAKALNPGKPCNGGLGGALTNQEQDTQADDAGGEGQPGGREETGSQSAGIGGGGGGKPDSAEEELKKELEGKSFDDHSMWPKDLSSADLEILRQMTEELTVFAAEEVEKGRGTVPGELKGRIEMLREKKRPRPVADWKRYFRRCIGNEFTEQLRKSKKRESRRFPDAAGNRHRRKSRILVGIDTSGSVSMPEYREFFAQMKTMIATTSFHILECDAEIQYEYEYTGKLHEDLHGGGGTRFEPVVDYFLQHRKEYEALVYFTDGGAGIPDNTPKETLWVVSSKGIKDKERYQVNGAKVLFIPPIQ